MDKTSDASGRPPRQSKMPYQLPFPPEAATEIVVPSALSRRTSGSGCRRRENVWFRPLLPQPRQGYWMNLLRVRKSGVLRRHRHPHAGPRLRRSRAAGTTSSTTGSANEGGYVFEPPGETHTLVVPDDVAEMITFFHVNGA